MVLLGGSGTRLRPLTLSMPKQALPIVEVPMIHRVLDHLGEHRVTRAVLSLGYLHEEFLNLFPEGHYGDMEITYAVEPEPLDTAGAIRFAATEAGIGERFVVANGDILTDLDVTALLRHHDAQPTAVATIALAHVLDPSAFGLVVTEPSDGRVQAFIEKPPAGQAPAAGAVNAGTYVFEPEALERIPDGRRVSVEREVFPALVDDGVLFAFESSAYWTDTGTPRQYLDAQLDLLNGRRHGPPAPMATRRDDGWWMGDADVHGRVVSPAFFGHHASVAADSTVDGSVIGSRAVVSAGASVVGSVLLAGARIDPGAAVARSIVGAGAVIGEGATLCNVSVVGAGASVEPGAYLDAARFPDGA